MPWPICPNNWASAWCMGTHFSLADVGAGCALGYLAFRFPEIDWRETYPNLARIYDKMLQRPAFADTVPQTSRSTFR